MNDAGVRPRKLSHWIAIAILAATVWHNPGGSAELAITTLDGLGTGLGWMLDRGGMDGESHYFQDPANPETEAQDSNTGTPGTEVGPPVTITGNESNSGDSFDTLAPLNGTADQAVVEIVRLHEIVEAVLAEESPS